jgi:predicted RNA-binding protein with PUA-like domain
VRPIAGPGVAHWLFKEEPSHYSFDDLLRDGETQWEGVHNALALRHLRSTKPGDTAFFYHSGNERRIVGILRVTSPASPDPSDARGSWLVTVSPVRSLPVPIELARLRQDPAFRDHALLRIPRLSIVPISEREWNRILSLGSASTPRATGRSLRRPRRGAETEG